jgi:hypothetical protein
MKRCAPEQVIVPLHIVWGAGSMAASPLAMKTPDDPEPRLVPLRPRARGGRRAGSGDEHATADVERIRAEVGRAAVTHRLLLPR